VRGAGIIASLDKMIGDLLQMQIQPSEIERMTFSKMQYYSSWAEAISSAHKRALDKVHA